MRAETARFLGPELDFTRRPDPPDFRTLVAELAARAENRGALVHVQHLPARPARHADPEPAPSEPVRAALASVGVQRLYLHQARALAAQRAGENVVVVSGTASGKSLCYHLPVLERLLADPEATALYLFPTKALAQDQLKGLTRLAGAHPALRDRLTAGVYDGDTAPSTRRRLRDQANVILSNPDMLHAGILPYHGKWGRFLRNLKTVVVDETHAYRGIFGSHVANVFRRLGRVAAHYGADFRWVLCSATIRNPAELAERLTGEAVTVVDEDGAPRGEKLFVFWNPPYRDATRVERRSSNVEGCAWLLELLRRGAQTIVFTKSRVAAELIYRYTVEGLERSEPALAERVKPYRGGYLPEERRKIEQALFSGALRGVISTNALELGIDVGGLDAAVLVGAPPTIASAWQQAGRAGRTGRPSLAVLVAYNETVDQYLMHQPGYFFGRSPEAAVIDPENPYILASQLACAAFELPLSAEDERRFGRQTGRVVEALEEAGEVKVIDGRGYWSQADYPAGKVNLRTISDDTYTIMNLSEANAVIGTVDAISALELVYPEAVYLHEGDTYFVRELDLKQKVAFVEPREVDYYTQPVLDTQIRIRGEAEAKDWRGERVTLGDAAVSWQTVAMKKLKFGSLDAIGYHPLELPRLSLETTAFWIAPGERAWGAVARRGLSPVEALSGVRNLFLTLLAVMAMCDKSDLGGMIDSSNLGRPALFVYDRYPGGLGFAEQGYARLDELLEEAGRHLAACECRDGCPSCVGLPILRPAQQQDPDLARGLRIPSKEAARVLLESWSRWPR
jgi:DEAD/DEAH box helicase domain-containing protein